MINKGYLKSKKNEMGMIYDLKHNDLHIQIRIIKDEEAKLKVLNNAEILSKKSYEAIGQIAKLEVDNARVEFEVKNYANIKENIISQIKIDGISWDFDIYNSGCAHNEEFYSMLTGGLRNSFDYKKLYIEFNLSEGQDDIKSKYEQRINPSTELDMLQLIKHLQGINGVGDVSINTFFI